MVNAPNLAEGSRQKEGLIRLRNEALSCSALQIWLQFCYVYWQRCQGDVELTSHLKGLFRDHPWHALSAISSPKSCWGSVSPANGLTAVVIMQCRVYVSPCFYHDTIHSTRAPISGFGDVIFLYFY